ncbi:hypothetical protein JCGZ_06436 [Jatropha curcas]|uniref:Uncharacterized protein n=1 Tax=Jatropha curcas TaxID=180498 RepID=A0A067KZV3_JATCU|nr:hypothetical protein JCGZ_06436 [Jatropha curcas]
MPVAAACSTSSSGSPSQHHLVAPSPACSSSSKPLTTGSRLCRRSSVPPTTNSYCSPIRHAWKFPI